MKRLLLSTTLIFGTLTGVMGSDALPDETAPSAPNVAGQPSAAVATVSTKTPDVFSQLLTEVSSLKTAQTTMNTTLQQLISVAPAVATLQTILEQRLPAPLAETSTPDERIDADQVGITFRGIFSGQDLEQRDQALNELIQQVNAQVKCPAITEEARRSIKQTIDNFIRSVSSYTPPLVKTNSFQLWTPNFKALLTMAVILDIYLAALFYKNVSKDSDLRLSVTVPMGGASTLGVCVAVLTKCFTTLKETSFPRMSQCIVSATTKLKPCIAAVKNCTTPVTTRYYRLKDLVISRLIPSTITKPNSTEITHSNYAKIQEVWGTKFKNSQSNAFLKVAISTYCAFNHIEITDSDLQKIFLSSANYVEIIEKLQEIESPNHTLVDIEG